VATTMTIRTIDEPLKTRLRVALLTKPAPGASPVGAILKMRFDKRFQATYLPLLRCGKSTAEARR
jgi:hypothetical protein